MNFILLMDFIVFDSIITTLTLRGVSFNLESHANTRDWGRLARSNSVEVQALTSQQHGQKNIRR